MGRKDPNREQAEETKQSRWGFRGMTVRDWLQLLIVPLVLVVIGFLFTMQQDARQQHIEDQRAQQAQKIENQRAEAEQELAKQNAQDEALQAYLDQMSDLLLNRGLRASKKDSEVRTLARARTLTLLDRVDPSRKSQVVLFLLESDLIIKKGLCRAFGDRRKSVPDDGATAAKKRRQAVARCVYRVASGRGSGHCDSPRRVFTKNATEPMSGRHSGTKPGRDETRGRPVSHTFHRSVASR